MVRIKTTTSKGKEFLSPLIYTELTGRFLINRLEQWHRKPFYELIFINFKDCPVDCFCNQEWPVDDLMFYIQHAEKIWQMQKPKTGSAATRSG